MTKPTPAQLKALTEGVLWRKLSLRGAPHAFFSKGSADPVCSFRSMAIMVDRGWFKVVGRHDVEITPDGRAAEREARGDAGKIKMPKRR